MTRFLVAASLVFGLLGSVAVAPALPRRLAPPETVPVASADPQHLPEQIFIPACRLLRVAQQTGNVGPLTHFLVGLGIPPAEVPLFIQLLVGVCPPA